jgi:hypothetical protein
VPSFFYSPGAHTGKRERKPQRGWWLGDWGFNLSLAFEARRRVGRCEFPLLPWVDRQE